VLALLGTAFFMTILDGTSLLTALPSIRQELRLDGTVAQWTVTAYALAFSGPLLFCGRAADLLGRRRMFLIGMVVRVSASMLCGFAPSGEILIAARALQGISAAIIAPAALSMVMNAFAEGPERNKALGIWGGLGGVGATGGLLLGGIVTETLGWQWVFWLNVPIGLVVLLLAPRLLHESRDRGRVESFDSTGALTITAALVLLVYAISGRSPWSLAGAIAMGVAFVVIERRSGAPLVPSRVLRSRTLIGGNLVILVAGMAVDGMLITLTAYVQQTLGWSAMRFGLVAAVMTVTSVVGGLLSQRFATRFGVRWVAATGTVLLGCACLLLTRVSSGGSLELVSIALLVFGAGMGAAAVCSQIAALTGVAEKDSGLAAGLVDTSFAVGTALGVAVCSGVAATQAFAISGQQMAFGAAAIFAAFGLVAVLTLLSSPGR
jgi:MFS family permease